MAEQTADAIWTTVQEFIRALRRRDPTLRRWIVPRSDADLLLDLYGEQALLILLRDYLPKKRFILLRITPPPAQGSRSHQVEIGRIARGQVSPATEDQTTFRLRLFRRRWQVEGLWPSALGAPPLVDRAREAAASQGEKADAAVLFLAGHLELPPEGSGELDDVETLFFLGMEARGFSPPEIIAAIRLWRRFSRRARSAYRKPAVFAAAVEYTFSLLGLYGDSQASIAAYYDVAPGSLRTRFYEIRDRLHLVCADPRYAVLEKPAEEIKAFCRARGLPWPAPLQRYLE